MVEMAGRKRVVGLVSLAEQYERGERAWQYRAYYVQPITKGSIAVT